MLYNFVVDKERELFSIIQSIIVKVKRSPWLTTAHHSTYLSFLRKCPFHFYGGGMGHPRSKFVFTFATQRFSSFLFMVKIHIFCYVELDTTISLCKTTHLTPTSTTGMSCKIGEYLCTFQKVFPVTYYSMPIECSCLYHRWLASSQTLILQLNVKFTRWAICTIIIHCRYIIITFTKQAPVVIIIRTPFSKSTLYSRTLLKPGQTT